MKADIYVDSLSIPSRCPSPSTNLCSINASVFYEIASILDVNDTWKRLFTYLPETYYSAQDVKQFEQEVRKSGSPSSALLFDMGHKGIKVSHLIGIFEKLQLERPLVYIREFQPVRLTKPMQTVFKIQGGFNSCLEIECPVSGFPRPDFQWFKLSEDGMHMTWEEIANACSIILCIKPVRLEDSGKYCCRFSNEDYYSKKVVCDFTEVITVFVEQDVFEISKDEDHFNVIKSPPEILKHPSCPSKGPFFQGTKLALECIAVGPEPITYEWFKNGELIPGEKKQVLNVGVQPEDDVVRFNYYCQVSNNYGKVHSDTVTIAVAPPRDGPQVYLAEDKVALVIANKKYDNHVSLRSAVTDAVTVAKLLKELDFKVLVAINLDQDGMFSIVREFCKLLDSGVYGVFYYAGHGFEVNKQCYMMPVDVPAGFSCKRCICVDEIKACMQQRNPALCCLLLDTCRKDPINTSEEVMEGFQVYQSKVDRNVICAYATSYTCSALDGPKHKNGLFVKHLRKYIAKELSIEEMLNRVFEDISVDPAASKKQFPSISEKTLVQTRRSLTDKIHAMLPNIEDRNKHYSSLTKTPSNFIIRLNHGYGNPVHIHITFELKEEVICNCVLMRILVTDENSRPVTSFTSFLQNIDNQYMNNEANFKQVLVEGQNLVIATFRNLQKLDEPLVVYGKLVHFQEEVGDWNINLGYPALSNIVKIQHAYKRERLPSATEDDESGIGSFMSPYEAQGAQCLFT